jgi:hypothetical protein
MRPRFVTMTSDPDGCIGAPGFLVVHRTRMHGKLPGPGVFDRDCFGSLGLQAKNACQEMFAMNSAQ